MQKQISFGEWLRKQRRALDLTRQAFADQIGCAEVTLRRIETGTLRPSKELAGILLEKLGISEIELPQWISFARGLSGLPSQSVTSPKKPITNLPAPITTFIGREKEQSDVIGLITKHRLVMLTGSGGVGKTRLSLKVGEPLLGDYPDGVWFVELAPILDPLLVPRTTAIAIGLRDEPQRPVIDMLSDYLHEKKMLIILDNCEHLLDACTQLADTLLKHCPDLKILATSREALGMLGEAVYPVPSLELPDFQQLVEKFRDNESVRLFEERAQLARIDFSLSINSVSSVAKICRQLDGIPLAIELAAARVSTLSPEQIAVRLQKSFNLLTTGNRTALPRHQTLQAAIDWSYELLSPAEQTLFRRLSVFVNGWTLEAAEFICSDANIKSEMIFDLLTQLINKSLVIAKEKRETRYQMLETIRQHGSEKLRAGGEEELMRRRHLAYFVDLAERAESNLRAFDMVMWLDRLETELDNIRAALEWALETDLEAQLRLASALLWFWHIHGHKNEGIDWLEHGLLIEVAERGNQPLARNRAMIRGKALNASGFLMNMFFNPKKAHARFKESLTLFQERGSAGKRGVAYALLGLASAVPSADNWQRNQVQQSLTLFREVEDKFGAAECLMQLTSLARQDNDYQQAIRFAEEQLALRKEIGDQDGIATALLYLANSVFWQNDQHRAITLLEESLAIYRELENKWAIGLTLSNFGDICLWQGDYKRAIEICEESLVFAQDLGDRYLVAFNVYTMGVIDWFQGDYAQATQKITDGLTVFRNIGEDWLTASSLHALGDISLAKGENKSAAQWYEAELAFGQGMEFNMSLAFAFCGLGKLAWVQGNYELATKKFEEGLKVGRDAGLKTATFHALYGLGRVTQSQGNYSAACSYYAEMLGMQQQRISPPPWALKTYGCAVAYPLEALAVLAAAQNRIERSTRLFGVAEILYPPLRFEMSSKERAEHDQAIAAARAALGEEAYIVAWGEGQVMTIEQAVKYALEES